MVRTKADSSCVKGKYTTMGFHIPFGRKQVFRLQSGLQRLCDLLDSNPITTFTAVEGAFLFETN
jgi:hypothetical protein